MSTDAGQPSLEEELGLDDEVPVDAAPEPHGHEELLAGDHHGLVHDPGPVGWDEFVAGWDIFADPIWCAAVSGLALGFLGVYVVLRRMVFVSAGVTQAAGLGVVLAFYSGIHWGVELDPSICAVVVALFATLVLVVNPERFGISREALLGLVYVLTGGAAVAIGFRIAQEAHDIENILFGSAVLVEPADLRRVIACAGVILFFNAWWFRALSFASFNPRVARAQGLPVRFLDGTLILSIGVMIGVTARALGAMPVFAISTMPAVAALLVCRARLTLTFIVAALAGAVSGVVGYMLAFFGELPVGPAQALVAVFLVVLAWGTRLLSAALAGRGQSG